MKEDEVQNAMKTYLLLILAFVSCTMKVKTSDEIIKKSIQAHGFDQAEGKKIEFDFRDKHYSVSRSKDKYTYTRAFIDSIDRVKDVLINSTEFERSINGNLIPLEQEVADKYANSVNSVLYFFQLPLPLQDPAVIKTKLDDMRIEGKMYHQIEVRFSEADGGKDFEDIFLYWINSENYLIDFLAYSYLTDGGGVRFRKAINRRQKNDFVFQDYINFKPKDKNIPLADLIQLFESGKLLELSRIENKQIKISEMANDL